MKQEVEKHLHIASKTLQEMEDLMAGGLYEAVVKRTYEAMLNAATAALLAREIQSDTRQAIVSEFNEAFVKTGLFEEKFYKYFRQAFDSKSESDGFSFAPMDHGRAQTNLLRVREFIAACRVLCD